MALWSVVGTTSIGTSVASTELQGPGDIDVGAETEQAV